MPFRWLTGSILIVSGQEPCETGGLNGISADMLLQAEGAAQHAAAEEHHRHYLLVIRVPGSGAAMVASA